MPFLTRQRLTFNVEGDWAPVWLPEGTQVAFTWLDPARADFDRCLVFMPIARRQIARELCPGGRDGPDSNNTVYSAAFSPGGRMAYVVAEGSIGSISSYRFLVVGRTDGSVPPRNVLDFPVTMANFTIHNTATHLAWLDESTLLYIGASITYVTGVPLPVDTTVDGLAVVKFDPTIPGPAGATVVPNTQGAQSIAVDPVTGIVYVGYGGGTIFTLDVATGQQTAAITLPLSPVRDIQVVGGRLVAVAGGASGHRSGEIIVADLPGGTPVVLTGPDGLLDGFYYARPALAPSRDRIIAEGFAYTIIFPVPGQPIRDTVVNHASDLFLLTVP